MMLAIQDHDPGDEDRRGSVACFCEPWCGLPICACGEDHGGIRGRCRDCDLDFIFDRMTCRTCGKLKTVRDGYAGDLAVALWGPDHRCECSQQKATS